MATIEAFSTHGMGPQEAIKRWNEMTFSRLGPLSIDACSDQPFQASMKTKKQTKCGLFYNYSPPAVIRGMVSPESSGELNYHIQRRGKSCTRIGGKAVILNPGDSMLYDAGQSFEYEFYEPNESIVVQIPRHVVEEEVPRLRQVVGRPIEGSCGVGAVIYALMINCWKQLQEDVDIESEWPEAIFDALAPLLVSAFSNDPMFWDDANRFNKRLKAIEFIEKRLTDPDLNVSQIANACNASTRFIQLMFAEIGTTPTSYILNKRLEFVAKMLSKGTSTSITELVFDAGFNDLSTFCRAFKRKYGVTARDIKRGQLANAMSL